MSTSKFATAEDLVNKGNSFFADEEYDEALEAYTAAIELEDDHVDAYLKRSAANYSLKNFSESIADANKAISLSPKSSVAFFRKGMGLFAESEYESAKAAFVAGRDLASDQKKFNMWIRKCDVELEESGVSTKPEATKVSIPSSPATTTPAAAVSTPSSTSTPTTTSNEASAVSSSAATTAQESEKPAPRFRHEWFQTDTHVNVDLFAKGIKKPNLKVEIAEKSLCVTIQLESSEFVLDLELADAIVPAESSYELLSTKIEIKLKKSKVARWKSLENTGENVVGVWDSQIDAKAQPPAYPSSKGAKNWDAIAKDDEEEKLTGDHALNNLFRTIYKDASEEQRRAMMKSYVESNGTVLSTNWEEVGAGEVKGQAPSGMEMHSWTESRDERSTFVPKKK